VTGELAGTEALLRWNHPRDGLRMPTSFVPIAESTGLIAEIGEWVVGEVATTLGEWSRQGIGRRIAFNVSPRQLDRADFFVRLRQVFADHGVPLSMVELEFTETAAIANLRAAGEFMRGLRGLGCQLALDDFGTGMSSFAYLKHLSVDFLKIDGSFIRDLVENPVDQAIVRAVQTVGAQMGIATVAEYVETAATRDYLRALGVSYGQGHAIARPAPLEQLALRAAATA